MLIKAELNLLKEEEFLMKRNVMRATVNVVMTKLIKTLRDIELILTKHANQ